MATLSRPIANQTPSHKAPPFCGSVNKINSGETVRSVLKLTMTNELMSKYNNTGAGQKRKFPEILLTAIARKTVLFEFYVADRADGCIFLQTWRMNIVSSFTPTWRRPKHAPNRGKHLQISFWPALILSLSIEYTGQPEEIPWQVCQTQARNTSRTANLTNNHHYVYHRSCSKNYVFGKGSQDSSKIQRVPFYFIYSNTCMPRFCQRFYSRNFSCINLYVAILL